MCGLCGLNMTNQEFFNKFRRFNIAKSVTYYFVARVKFHVNLLAKKFLVQVYEDTSPSIKNTSTGSIKIRDSTKNRL